MSGKPEWSVPVAANHQRAGTDGGKELMYTAHFDAAPFLCSCSSRSASTTYIHTHSQPFKRTLAQSERESARLGLPLREEAPSLKHPLQYVIIQSSVRRIYGRFYVSYEEYSPR